MIVSACYSVARLDLSAPTNRDIGDLLLLGLELLQSRILLGGFGSLVCVLSDGIVLLGTSLGGGRVVSHSGDGATLLNCSERERYSALDGLRERSGGSGKESEAHVEGGGLCGDEGRSGSKGK
jgi:hypothetical protein